GAGGEDVALQTIAAAAEAGVTVFDTAHAYGSGAADLGRNERLLARALRLSGAQKRARIVTKGGMTRPEGAWVPDGRAKAILSDCEASLTALDGLPIDLYLLHAPDPRTPWSTSVRALSRLIDQGVVRHVGLANVNRRQLDEALELVDVTAVQVALSAYDDTALRGGVVDRCAELGIALIAHSPLGGPRRAVSLARDPVLADVAEAHDSTPAEVALAWLLELSPVIVAIPGARRPDTARSAAHAATLRLGAGDRTAIAGAFGRARPVHPGRARTQPHENAEVVVVMGIPGAGKSRVAQKYVDRGYLRLNRDERGGSLRAIADALDKELSLGVRSIVLDNTYLTRATRSYVVESARRHRVPARCVWLDTPLAQAQVNLVERLLQRFGSLPAPEELQALARREPGLLLPTSQMRALRELEPPATDEGFAAVEQVPFVRTPSSQRGRVGVFVAAAALQNPDWIHALGDDSREAPHLIFDWIPDGSADVLVAHAATMSEEVSGPVEAALCTHPAGPPTCWCRPPLPGLPLAFARAHGVDPSRSILIGTGPAHRTLATTLGARYIAL
ncbi:MAG TPA: aldo/keto reductase, partial [Candidatus Acidoferrales bacterium]|nr:aldo/keto reductase [Candidatus Acidoferrales bacterium]